ncbi:hypothetical protein DFH29DRAFT_970185 [Suillus ampliporus]|nr:hypothetical protein DFH29DRAFT_970185 [Suillus ampliporus]
MMTTESLEQWINCSSCAPFKLRSFYVIDLTRASCINASCPVRIVYIRLGPEMHSLLDKYFDYLATVFILTSTIMARCTQCDRSFRSTQALFAHCRDKVDHPFCENCDRLFLTFNRLDKVCDTHVAVYLQRRELTPLSCQHLQIAAVHRSDREDKYAFDNDEEYSFDEEEEYVFDSDEEYAFDEEYVFDNDEEHAFDNYDDDDEEPFCAGCDRWFVDLESLYKYFAASSKHNWCFVCSRDFSTPTSLDQHAASPVHRALDLECPLCPKRFKTPSSIALHIESGTSQVTAAVHALNIVPMISISCHIEGWTPCVVTYYVTERAFNGTAYECYLCHRTFRTLGALNSHINSPAHDADEFKCPKCKWNEGSGLARFQVVDDLTRGLVDQSMRRLKL